MSLIKPVYIEKKTEQDPALDFAFLRAEGIELLQELSGKTWTDFNFHDPGVTILEQLCFAITDMAYRTEAPIEDILTNARGQISRADNSFFRREQILTTNPVTVSDFRKVILDDLIDEVENVQLEPLASAYSSEYVKGLYRIIVQVNDEIADQISREPASEKGKIEKSISKKVMNSFLSRRNLSEDCIRVITVLKPQEITIRAHIIIAEHLVAEEVLAAIYNSIDFALNPHVTRYSEQELIEKNWPVEEIYCGPLLKNGIIPDSELRPFKNEIDPSELVSAISKVEGVLYVQNLVINDQGSTGMGKPFRLEKGSFPLLKKSLRPGIKLFTDKYELQIKVPVFQNILGKLHELTHKRVAKETQDPDSAHIRKGAYRDLGHYESIQNYFPVVYGIGKDGLSDQESRQRKAQAKQLKGYLLFFEQVLANYLSQLSNVGRLLSPDIGRDNSNTYYFQHLDAVPGIDELLTPFVDEPGSDHAGNAYTRTLSRQQETGAQYIERKNRIFDHLLARINKTLNEYPVVMYNSVYGHPGIGRGTDLVLKWKSEILKNMVETNQDRIRAFNYTQAGKNTSGFEKKLLALLNIAPRNHRALTQVFSSSGVTLTEGKKQSAHHHATDMDVKDPGTQEEEQNIFLSAEEVSRLQREKKIVQEDGDGGEAYTFRNQGLSVLKDGIRIGNYRIAPALHDTGKYSILYRAPSGPSGSPWKIVSTHPDEKVAMKALYRLIRSLKDLSIHSEGFYMMEHILLRPELNQPSFGFRFYESPDKLLFENNDWLGFDGREDHIGEILRAAGLDMPGNPKPAAEAHKYKVYTKEGHPVLIEPREIYDGKNHSAVHEFKALRDNLALLKNGQINFYPRFELTTKLGDGSIIREDFFNFRITIVLPAWPARFQDQDFRTFTEDLFKLNAPAYVRLEFMWLGVSDMQTFEGLHFSWLDMFSRETPYEEKNSQSAKLIGFLKSEAFK